MPPPQINGTKTFISRRCPRDLYTCYNSKTTLLALTADITTLDFLACVSPAQERMASRVVGSQASSLTPSK